MSPTTVALERFSKCCRGNFALFLALLAPVLLGLVGGVTDFYVFAHHKSELQSAADAGALAAAREASLKGWSAASAQEVAAAVIRSDLANRFGTAVFGYTAEVDEKERQVKLTLSQDNYRYFLIGYFTGSPQIRVTAVARQTGQETLCIMAQAPKGSAAFAIDGGADVSAVGCSAYSGSIDHHGLAAKGASAAQDPVSVHCRRLRWQRWKLFPATDQRLSRNQRSFG